MMDGLKVGTGLKQGYGLAPDLFNLLAPELFFLILAHPVYKM